MLWSSRWVSLTGQFWVTSLLKRDGINACTIWLERKPWCSSCKKMECKMRRKQNKTKAPSPTTIHILPCSWSVYPLLSSRQVHQTFSGTFNNPWGCSLGKLVKCELVDNIVSWFYSGLNKHILRVLTYELMLTWRIVPGAMLSGFAHNPFLDGISYQQLRWRQHRCIYQIFR
jgi:hypothetical protein